MNEQYDGRQWFEHDALNGRPFCPEMDCGCHEDAEAIAELEELRQDGLASDTDCNRIYRGLTV